MLCCIPARAGSKRIPGKNVLSLAGKPMIAYTIENAVASGLFNKVYVCTEDADIADISRRYGGTVPTLVPPDLCGDLVPSHVPCQYIADFLKDHGTRIDTIICLQPTSPLRSVEDIKLAVHHFMEGDFNFLVSVTPIDPHYFHWAVVHSEANYWHLHFGNRYLKERSLLPPAYRPNGSIKIARLDLLQKVNHFFGPKMGVMETPEERSVHVGTRLDFDLCEFLLSRRKV
jgi:CMP-N-acetylneuraminic acid synthetase